MGSKKKGPAVPEAPEYAKATYSTGGLFGSATSDKNGTSYNPNSEMSQIGNMSWGGLGNALNNINNFDYRDYTKDNTFKLYADNLKNQMNDYFSNNVLSKLANNGLMRSSGLQSAVNSFNKTMADQTANLYNQYVNTEMNRQNNTLAANQNTLNNLYNYINGVNSNAMNNVGQISNFDLNNYQNKLAQYKAEQEQQKNNKSGLWSKIGSAVGTAAGAYFGAGNPLAAKLGAMAGEKLGGMADR